MKRLAATLASVLVVFSLSVEPAMGSGDPGPITVFIDRHGGTDAERSALYRGHMGVLLANQADGLLYLQWRLMNGLDVGQKAGEALNQSCCDIPVYGDEGLSTWAKATMLVRGGPQAFAWLPTELPGPDYTSIPNCFGDAFDSAAATLRNRVARFGPANAAVKAWLVTQTAVFAACSDPNAALPPPMANAPAWLRADRAYQEAAFALYKGQNDNAFSRFQAIAGDRNSPWQPMGLYLAARARHRAALAHPSPLAFAAARAAIAPLQAQPGAYGHGEVHGMLRALAFRDHPNLLFKKLDEELNARTPVADIAKGLRDFELLSGRFTPRPDISDWLSSFRTYQRDDAFAHATERWRTTKKLHWLIATLSLTRTNDPQAQVLAADAAKVPATSPAWLTAQYHQMRLTFAREDATSLRHRVDAILATGLSSSDRNLFLGLRTQVATSLPDFMAHALRQAFCSEVRANCDPSDTRYDSRLAVGRPGEPPVAIGPEALAILDRLPLDIRMQAGAKLPRPLQLDLALTNFGRAVQLQNNAAIDQLAVQLATLLPTIREDWLTVRRTPPGAAKRFAEFLILAKIPGVAPDLVDYTRPRGTLHNWQGSWWDWMILPRPAPKAIDPRPLSSYNDWGYWAPAYDDAQPDLACYGYCGAGDFPLRLPAFAVAAQPAAQAERNRMLFYTDDTKANVPEGSISAWSSLLEYARANPRDPRSPEALFWLIRISHWGQSHDRIGYQAFRLLHSRYPGSNWTKRSPYYYD